MKLHLLSIFIFIISAFSVELAVVCEVFQTGLVVADEYQWLVYDQIMNKTTIYDYAGKKLKEYTTDFMTKGESCDWIIKNSLGSYYLFNHFTKTLYQTDAEFKLTNSVTLLKTDSRMLDKFFENSLQNLMFFDKKSNSVLVLNRNEITKVWSETETPDDVFYNKKKLLFLFNNNIVVKDEKGIRFHDLPLPFTPDYAAVNNDKIVCCQKNKLLLINIETNEKNTFIVDFPPCKGLNLYANMLLYSTKDKIIIINLDGKTIHD